MSVGRLKHATRCVQCNGRLPILWRISKRLEWSERPSLRTGPVQFSDITIKLISTTFFKQTDALRHPQTHWKQQQQHHLRMTSICNENRVVRHPIRHTISTQAQNEAYHPSAFVNHFIGNSQQRIKTVFQITITCEQQTMKIYPAARNWPPKKTKNSRK